MKKRLFALILVIAMVIFIPLTVSANLLPNGDFSDGLNRWIAFNEPALVAENFHPTLGDCMHMPAGGALYQMLNRDVGALQAGVEYTLTITYFVSGSIVPGDSWIHLNPDSNFDTQLCFIPLNEMDKWTTTSVNFIGAETASAHPVRIIARPNTPDVYVAEVIITQVGGAVETPTEAPTQAPTNAPAGNNNNAGGGGTTTAPPMGDTAIILILMAVLGAGAVVVSRRLIKNR